MQKEHPTRFNSFTDWLRWQTRGMVAWVADKFNQLGLHPNTVTLVGPVLVIVAGWFASQGQFVRAGILYLVAGPLDAFDGALARATGRVSRFGALLDSTLDRYSEGLLLSGIGYWLVVNGRLLDVMLVFATIIGSTMVSYVRARAEGLGLELKVGLMTRVERYIIMLLALFSGQLTIGLALLAALTNFTALQRVLKVYNTTRHEIK